MAKKKSALSLKISFDTIPDDVFLSLSGKDKSNLTPDEVVEVKVLIAWANGDKPLKGTTLTILQMKYKELVNNLIRAQEFNNHAMKIREEGRLLKRLSELDYDLEKDPLKLSKAVERVAKAQGIGKEAPDLGGGIVTRGSIELMRGSVVNIILNNPGLAKIIEDSLKRVKEIGPGTG